MDRREFPKSGLQAAAGAALIGGGVACGAVRTEKRISVAGGIAARSLGKTGYLLPVLGYGGSAMVEKWSRGYNVERPSREDRVATVREDLTLTEEDRMLLADYAVRAHQSDYVKSMAVV
jgi:hypothetical protein